jgi:hypothetical protein
MVTRLATEACRNLECQAGQVGLYCSKTFAVVFVVLSNGDRSLSSHGSDFGIALSIP